MTEEYELSSYDRHELNYDHVALGRLPMPVSRDPMAQPIAGLNYVNADDFYKSKNLKTFTD